MSVRWTLDNPGTRSGTKRGPELLCEDGDKRPHGVLPDSQLKPKGKKVKRIEPLRLRYHEIKSYG